MHLKPKETAELRKNLVEEESGLHRKLPGPTSLDAYRMEAGGVPVLVISDELKSVRVGERTVPLDNRPSLWRLLGCLVHRRLSDPGARISTEELIGLGWPGERVRKRAGKNRVYVAISTLRKLGLDDVIEKADDGYRIGPRYSIRL